MPRYRFIGDPQDGFEGPDRFEWQGIEFSRDEWADVADADLVTKLDGNSHFERADDGTILPSDAPKRRGRPPKARD